MPCVPIGTRASSGRTSRLKRFLSIPRYDGASRKRIKRGRSGEGSAKDLGRPTRAGPEKACSIIDEIEEELGNAAVFGAYPPNRPTRRSA
jgi:hypothetical protein